MSVLFQTPPIDLPEEIECRTFKIPSSGIWLGIFNAMALTLLNPYNWERVEDTDMTIEDTILMIAPIIQEYWDTEVCCDSEGCLQPSGNRILRLDINGYIQQLANGGWIAPTDDYEIPPTPARTEPTASERKCLAAANALNVLQQTYEQVTDGIAEGVTVAELAVLFATELTILLGPMFGFIVPAFIFLLEAAALAFIEIAEYLGTDVWDAEFSDALLCILVNCTADTDDVVTFDYQCVIDGMAKGVDLLSPTGQAQLLLFGQVNFMLSIIGVDGLNLAGATTAVETADCTECLTWCYEWNIDLDGLDGWSEVLGSQGTPYSYLGRTFTATEITYVLNEFTITGGTGGTSGASIWRTVDDFNPGTRMASLTPVGTTLFVDWHGAEVLTELTVGINDDGFAGAATAIRRIVIGGNGINPFGVSNCEL